ncbi:hypothetical protein C0J52_26105 [Blattella germanica]|nr:hypothetical protein C0J52_26105 [Blattella germanica]
MPTNWYKMAAVMNRYCENDGIEEVWEAVCASLVPERDLSDTDCECIGQVELARPGHRVTRSVQLALNTEYFIDSLQTSVSTSRSKENMICGRFRQIGRLEVNLRQRYVIENVINHECLCDRVVVPPSCQLADVPCNDNFSHCHLDDCPCHKFGILVTGILDTTVYLPFL